MTTPPISVNEVLRSYGHEVQGREYGHVPAIDLIDAAQEFFGLQNPHLDFEAHIEMAEAWFARHV